VFRQFGSQVLFYFYLKKHQQFFHFFKMVQNLEILREFISQNSTNQEDHVIIILSKHFSSNSQYAMKKNVEHP
jgi:hypothetical protein